MPSTRDIRRRIKSIKSTAQITKAMQMVASAKMKKAQDQATNHRAAAEMFNKILVGLREHVEQGAHPFLSEGRGAKTLMVIITTDKGLCGALNTNLLKKLFAEFKGDDVDFISVGRKGSMALGRLKKNLLAEFQVVDPARFPMIRPIGKLVQEKFLTGEYKTVKVAFNNFVNTVTQVPMLENLLPIKQVTLGGRRNYHEEAGAATPEISSHSPQYTFEPGVSEVLNEALPDYVNYTLYQMILESRASEHSSRMVAMKNATDNAKQIVKDLTLEYNKLRQAAITNELLEITTAKMALE